MDTDKERYVLDETGITCPSCLKVKYTKNDVSRYLGQLKSLEYSPVSHADNQSIYFLYSKEYKTEKDYLKIKWACNECLGREKAFISVTIHEQRKTDTAPVFAFFDLKSTCAKCRSDFIFKKDEWRYWIDELGFYFQTTKKYCENCYPIEKLKKKLSHSISEHRDLEFGERYVELSLSISESYLKHGARQKSKGFLKSVINEFKENDDARLKEVILKAYEEL